MLLIGSAVATAVMIGVPEWEVPIAMGSTIVAGLAYLFAGLRAASARADVR